MDDITPEEEHRLLLIIGRGLVLSDVIDPTELSKEVYLSAVNNWVAENADEFQEVDFTENWEHILIEYSQAARDSVSPILAICSTQHGLSIG
jgi:rhodanese-related sulfurtransferase